MQQLRNCMGNSFVAWQTMCDFMMVSEGLGAATSVVLLSRLWLCLLLYITVWVVGRRACESRVSV
jgi:hypothetical protein